MQRVELDRLLRVWGRIYGLEPVAEWEEDSSHGSGALTGCLIEFLRVGVVSGPEVGEFAEGVGLTARGRESQGGAKPMKAHPEADLIDSLVCRIYKNDRRAAVCLRASYCLRGYTMTERCQWASAATSTRVSRMGFRTAVIRGRLEVERMLTPRARS